MKGIICKFCEDKYNDIDSYAHHLETKHDGLLPPNMDGYQFIYFLRTKRTHGNCVICKSKTEWNEKTRKYARFCKNPKCKEKYVEQFRKRMIGKHGKITLLNDPEHQRKMLKARSISGTYKWSDGKEVDYTGSYELDFLKFLDTIMDFSSDDIISPSPHTYYYIYDGERKFYIPDVYIPSLNLEIEIKDGGDNANMHPKIQAVDKVKERLKDEVMTSNKNTFNYLKIVNKENKKFFKYLEVAKQNFREGVETPIVML